MVHNGRPSHVGTQRQTVRATNTHTHTKSVIHVGTQRQETDTLVHNGRGGSSRHPGESWAVWVGLLRQATFPKQRKAVAVEPPTSGKATDLPSKKTLALPSKKTLAHRSSTQTAGGATRPLVPGESRAVWEGVPRLVCTTFPNWRSHAELMGILFRARQVPAEPRDLWSPVNPGPVWVGPLRQATLATFPLLTRLS